jgi:WD40 repeat protein
VAYSPDGTTIVSGGMDGTLRRWDVTDGAPLGEPLVGHDGWVLAVAYSPDGATIASGSSDGTLRLWDAASGAQVGTPLTGHDDGVRALAYSPDGATIVSGSDDGTLRLWDAVDGSPLVGPLLGHDHWVEAVVFSPDGTTIVSAGSEIDGTLRRWATPTTWVAAVCDIVNRNLTQAEWDTWIGTDVDYVRSCPMLLSGHEAPSDAPAAQYPSWLTSTADGD